MGDAKEWICHHVSKEGGHARQDAGAEGGLMAVAAQHHKVSRAASRHEHLPRAKPRHILEAKHGEGQRLDGSGGGRSEEKEHHGLRRIWAAGCAPRGSPRWCH